MDGNDIGMYDDDEDENGSIPTFDDLAINENLTSLERVEKYTQSTISLQRLVHVKLIGDLVSFNTDNINTGTNSLYVTQSTPTTIPLPTTGSISIISADQIVIKDNTNNGKFIS